MQNFDPNKQHERTAMLEKAVFGHDVPDYVRQPSADEPFPPIRQVDSGERDKFGQPIMIDATVHKPGLLDAFAALHSVVHGVEPAATEGGAVNAMALLSSMAQPVAETATKKKSRK